MSHLETIFEDADNVAMASLVSLTQLPAMPGLATQTAQPHNAAISMFDDDLDVGAPTTGAGAKRYSPASVTSQALNATRGQIAALMRAVCISCTSTPPVNTQDVHLTEVSLHRSFLTALFEVKGAMPPKLHTYNTAETCASHVAAALLVAPSARLFYCRPTSAGPASASLATSCRINCLILVTSLGKLDPVSAAAVITRLLRWYQSSPILPPTELLHQLIQSLCVLVATPGGHNYMKQAIAFLAAEEDGLLSHRRIQRDEVLLAVQQLAVLAKAFFAQNGKKQSAGDTHTSLGDDHHQLLQLQMPTYHAVSM